MRQSMTETNILDHLKMMVVVLSDTKNDPAFIQSIYDLPYDISISILTTFTHYTISKMPHPMINKHELYSMSNKDNRKFTRNFKTILGRAKIETQLDIISNIMTHTLFNEREYTYEDLFQAQLGFKPTEHYIHRLHELFPDNKIFKIVHMDDIY